MNLPHAAAPRARSVTVHAPLLDVLHSACPRAAYESTIQCETPFAPAVRAELRRRNALDVELYDWARNRTLAAIQRWDDARVSSTG